MRKSIKPEKAEEKKFGVLCDVMGWEYIKQQMFMAYGRAGMNDRICLIHAGITVIFEWKAEDEEPTRLQAIRHRKLRKLGHHVYVVYSCKEAFEICKRILRAEGLSIRKYKIRRITA